jgi:hypothetical protein
MFLTRSQIVSLLHYLGRVNPRGYNDETELIRLIGSLEAMFNQVGTTGGVKSSSKLHGFQPEVVQSR